MGGYNYLRIVLLITLLMLTIAIIATAFISTVVQGAGLGAAWIINLIAIDIGEGGPWG